MTQIQRRPEKGLKIDPDVHQLLVKASDNTGTTIKRILQSAIWDKFAKLNGGSTR